MDYFTSLFEHRVVLYVTRSLAKRLVIMNDEERC